MRIGIDVGGTHTDAVVMNGNDVLATFKALTSADVKTGIVESLDAVMARASLNAADITAVMIGTTQFTNAVIERRELSPTAIIRACLPTGTGIPPMCDWPEDIAAELGNNEYRVLVVIFSMAPRYTHWMKTRSDRWRKISRTRESRRLQ